MRFLLLCLVLSLGGTDNTPSIQPQMAGGRECANHSHPWMVFLGDDLNTRCGGVLVDRKWVLTSADCLIPTITDNAVWLGIHNISQRKDSGQYARISRGFVHPYYQTWLKDRDASFNLMLLRLEEPVTMTPAVRVLDLPTKEPKTGTYCQVPGWGVTEFSSMSFDKQYPDVLHCVGVVLRPYHRCSRSWRVTKFTQCAGHKYSSGDICVGDTGSPLVCDGLLHGIMAESHTKCDNGPPPPVYTKVWPHMTWIKITIWANP